MAPSSSLPTSTYQSYLPAGLQPDPIIQAFLLAFEQILTGERLPAPAPQGLEEMIDRLPTYLIPMAPAGVAQLEHERAPGEFLPWLASWVALSLRDDWSADTKRAFIQRIVPLYTKRGTKDGVREMLELYVSEGKSLNSNVSTSASKSVEIFELVQPAHYFQVTIRLPNRDDLERKRSIARTILDQEKPAHTFYRLELLFDTMRLITPEDESDPNSKGLRLGINTLLGTESG